MDKIKILKKIVKTLIKCNWFKTIHINFKTQKFKNAFKFPIIVFVDNKSKLPPPASAKDN